jgi:mono/diheme cytochrome c family protein
MKRKLKGCLLTVVIVIVLALLFFWIKGCIDARPEPDEAMAAGLTKADFAQAEDEPDYFADADGGIELTPAEIRGRNTWWVWTGGNQAFWDYLANHSFGTHDLLKTISSFPCSPEGEAAARDYEAGHRGATDDGYGEYHPAVPPGGYGEDYDEEYQGACSGTMYPEPGRPPYRYYDRDTRFCYAGLINEPGFQKASKPGPRGLCVDERTTSEDPFDEAVYGRPSGIMGLRIFDNPNFDEEAAEKWDPVRYYTDPSYYSDNELVRPYRVGMSCGFCHISHHPLHPPEDPENPTFANLSGTIGAQYFWFGRVLGSNVTPDNFAWHLLDAQLPGAVDTSFVPSDNLNNPRAMNAIFDLPARLAAGTRFHPEVIDGGALDLPEVQKHMNGEVSEFGVPHILWDGADSVGIDAALTRVYINIGEYHQEWIKHIQPIISLNPYAPQSPITVEAAQNNSVFWQSTQDRAADMAAYLIRAGYRYDLADVDQRAGGPDGTEAEETEAAAAGDRGEEAREAATAQATAQAPEDVAEEGPDEEGDAETLASAAVGRRGAVVFAESCARCHSSKLPENLPGLDGGLDCAGENWLQCWADYWQHTETPQFQRAMTEMVLAPDFLENNYLSTDARIPVHQPLLEWDAPASVPAGVAARYRAENPDLSDTLIEHLERARLRGLATGALESEICSSMATNAIEGHVWDNFASRSYKSLPAVGTVELYDPVGDRLFQFETPGGGRGYQRVPSLISIWTTAPFLHNNEVGTFTGDPSVEGRLFAFESGIRELLWPELRDHKVSRTRDTTYIKVNEAAMPTLVAWGAGLAGLTEDGDILIGPVPDGTPVNLLSNLMVDSSDPRFGLWALLGGVRGLAKDLKAIEKDDLDDAQAAELLRGNVPRLIDLSNCPDFIPDRGHYFGTDLSDEDKEALIEYLKTL